MEFYTRRKFSSEWLPSRHWAAEEVLNEIAQFTCWMELPTSTELFNSRETQAITPVNVLGRRFVIASFEHLCDNAAHSCNLLRRMDEPFFTAADWRS